MTDDLVRRLQNMNKYEPLGYDGWEAADRIEQLVATNEAMRLSLAAIREAALREAAAYVSQKSLQWRFFYPWHGKDFAKEILALAEIKGESHE
jgi:hypothetical protein